jgi:hypothetical protein
MTAPWLTGARCIGAIFRVNARVLGVNQLKKCRWFANDFAWYTRL